MDHQLTASQRLAQTIQILRSRIAEERLLYGNMQRTLETDFPEAWAAVSQAIKDVAVYYSGEIARAKNDMADWMQGHKVVGTYADHDAVNAVHEYINDIRIMFPDPDEDEMKAAVELIRDMLPAVEEARYARQ